MALAAVVEAIQAGEAHVVDVDLAAYFDTIDHELLMKLVERRVGDLRILRLLRAWLTAGVLDEGQMRHPDRGTPQGGVISPLLSNIMLHEVDRQWCGREGEVLGPARLIRYADDMVLLAPTAEAAEKAWQAFQRQVEALHLRVNSEKSRTTTVSEGFAFLGFEFRQPRRRLYMWPRSKARRNIGRKIRTTVRSIPSSMPLGAVVQKLNPVLNGWCTYFRVGNSNRVFHVVDWMARSEVQLWLRRKHRCRWRTAKRRWGYAYLHDRCRLYRMVGRVSHLPGLERMLPATGGRRAVCGKTARTVR
jgi:RNA-directed DNA polymerase